MHIEVVTLFPEMIRDALRHGVLGRALQRGLLQVGTEDPRAHTSDVHRTVDDRPYGGGPGMVMKPEPLCAAIGAARARLPTGSVTIALSAQGALLTQERLRGWCAVPGLLLVAGRYEGIDERVLISEVDLELSIGDYVLSGGELPVLVLIDALARLLPGVLVMSDLRCRSLSAPGCSIGRITRGRKNMLACACRRCCSRAIMRPLTAGVSSRHWAAAGNAGQSCWPAKSWMRSARRCCRNL